jgi:hypothetical protein
VIGVEQRDGTTLDCGGRQSGWEGSTNPGSERKRVDAFGRGGGAELDGGDGSIERELVKGFVA